MLQLEYQITEVIYLSRERFVTTLDPDLIKKLKIAAVNRGVHVNELLEEMIRDLLTKED